MAKKKHGGTPDVAALIVAHLRAREIGRRHYAKSDRLLEAIVKKISRGKEIPLPGGKKAVLKDNFADANKVFRSHGIARYELEVIEA